MSACVYIEGTNMAVQPLILRVSAIKIEKLVRDKKKGNLEKYCTAS
jgi:hypothetical protein